MANRAEWEPISAAVLENIISAGRIYQIERKGRAVFIYLRAGLKHTIRLEIGQNRDGAYLAAVVDADGKKEKFITTWEN